MKKLIPLTLLVLMSCNKGVDQIDVATPAAAATTSAIQKTFTTKTTASAIIKGVLVKDEDLAAKSTIAIVDMFGSAACTGTLVSKDLVITAAHCVSRWTEKSFFKRSKQVPELSRIAFKLNSSNEITKIEMDAVEFYPAKNERDQQAHDIAVVKFTGQLPKGFEAVAILAPEYQLVGNKDLVIAGFGYTSKEKNSKDVFTPVLHQTIIPYKGSEGDILILTQLNGEQGAYYGDSGGPAYLESNDELFLVGATIGGFDGESEVYYSKVNSYKKFILDSAKKLKGTPPVFKSPEE